ncbi:SURF1 family protein [Nesterenkonia halotolerans]|uniref:SURF1-like protein n=1 Tax=Nesterenkonia halotolerans TaxID=225325 RepID=A0ABR9J9X1_9MICC|nr:SURF1 family protein [Nesterenkonia halotolerans]MBE1515794.1 cytochrome oxidase assembly protein ShyY1 [Nesterenkonia halotolerans]
MLKTAMQPKWIGTLVLALVLASVFVVLSAWQFSQSETEPVPTEDITETPVALTEVHQPEQAMTVAEADRIVDFSGEFLPDTQVLIEERLQNGETGYWVIGAFRPDDAPGENIIPVVRGWVADPADADAQPAEQELTIQGRLLPPEAPGPGPREYAEDGTQIFPTLSPAELINVWDQPGYSGFVVAFDMLDAAGDEVGAASSSSALEPVEVGPQPEATGFNWLNLFYGVEWTVFAGFAFYLWWRLVKDAHEKQLEEERLDREWQEQWRAEQLALREQNRTED